MRTKDGSYGFSIPMPCVARRPGAAIFMRLAVVVMAAAAGLGFGNVRSPADSLAPGKAVLDDFGAAVAGSVNGLTVTGPVEPNLRERANARRRLVAALKARSFLQPGPERMAAESPARVLGKMQDRIPARAPTDTRTTPTVFADGTEWQARSFIAVNVLDGRSFRAGDITVRLVGVELPAPAAKCRLLDGRLRRCTDRAEAQLDLTTRRRRIDCDVRPLAGPSGVYGGKCRIGSRDLNALLIDESWARPITPGSDAPGATTVRRTAVKQSS